MRSREKGFTIIELVLSFGIMSIITSLVMMFFISNYKSFKLIKNDTELQFHAQYILNYVSNKIMESSKVEVIRTNGTTSVINSAEKYNISKMSLLYNEENLDCFIFEVRNDKIYYGNGKSNDLASVELGTYVTELQVAPYPEGKTFAQTSALRLTIKLTKESQVFEANQIIYMRNS